MPDLPAPISDLIAWARSDREAFGQARALFGIRAPALFARGDEPKVCVTSSDAGRCGAQVQAEIRGDYDIPDSGFGSRDAGTLRGCWAAELLVVALGHKYGVDCFLEESLAWQGIPGHTDVAVYDLESERCLWVVEIKTTMSFTVRPPHEPGKTVPANLQHVVQGAHRALAHGAPIFTVYTMGPGDVSDQSDFATDSWREAVVAEYARLQAGAMDPQRDYQCKSCRWSRCLANVNPLRAAYWPEVAV